MKVQFISPVLAFMALAVNATPTWSNPHISQSTPEENLSDFIQEEEKIKHTQETPPEPTNFDNFESTYNTAVIFQCDNSHTIPIMQIGLIPSGPNFCYKKLRSSRFSGTLLARNLL